MDTQSIDSDGADYCARLVCDGDEDLRLTLPYLADGDRSAWTAAFALALELRRVPGAVSEAPLGEIRLQWWRDAVREIADDAPVRAHPVLRRIARAGIVADRFVRAVEDGADGRARLLYGDPFRDVEDLFNHFAAAEGWLAAAMLGDEEDASVWRKRIGAYALARWGASLAPNLPNEEIAEFARGLSRDRGGAPEAGPAVAPLLFTALTEGYVRRPAGEPWPVIKRLVLLRAMARGGP